MKKKIISLTLTLCMLAAAFVLASCGSGENVDPKQTESKGNEVLKNDSFRYSVVDGYVVIDKYIGSDTDVVVPSEIEGKTVKVVGESAFISSTAKVKSIVFADTVEVLENNVCLGLTTLETVVFGSSLKTVGDNAFYLCSSLKSMTLPSTLESIGILCFAGCDSLTEIIIPQSVASIGNKAFSSCDSLVSLTLPEIYRSSIENITLNCSDALVVSYS
ncbi:MAG: leucine-rich repeat domain-containing protein [Clostridia bacterium]|nr:leucine-rich repeat domain-containing protein [Clostridia bacterium]